MIRKLMIVPWFGPLPDWYDEWKQNVASLQDQGYDFLVPMDFAAFQQRVKETLGVELPEVFEDRRKPCDFRPAFGVIFEKELRGYEFWGHTDMDVVYGRLNHFITDKLLNECDIFSNDAPTKTICGPFSLFRNTPKVNELFKRTDWEKILIHEELCAFDERLMSYLVATSDLRVEYRFWQQRENGDITQVHFEQGRLMDGDQEIMMCHFRHQKEWPAGAFEC